MKTKSHVIDSSWYETRKERKKRKNWGTQIRLKIGRKKEKDDTIKIKNDRKNK